MPLRIRAACALIFLSPLLATSANAQDSVALVGGTAPVQTFASLAATGTGSTLPEGWYFAETGGNANTTYEASDGNANAGNTYSFGTGSSAERALGGIRSGSLNPTIGARLRNDSGAALSEIAVAYTGEQWRLGTSGRADRLQFEYSTNATGLGNGSWTHVAALDFSSPATTGATGPRDGNAAANRTLVAASISGLNLAVGASLWVRWVDIDASGADDGLAIDDASFTVAGDPPVDVPPSVTTTSPSHGAVNVPLGAPLSVTFSEPVEVAAPWFTLTCTDSGSHGASVAGGPVIWTLTPAPGFSADETCTWTILGAGVSDLDGEIDAMQGDVVVIFTTLDPGGIPRPFVQFIQPAENAQKVPVAADIRVTFNETVTTGTGAFALQCDAAPITLAVAGSGSLRAITPGALLPYSAHCEFTISAAAVQNTGGATMLADVTIPFQVMPNVDVATYYAQVNESSPGQLRCSLHATIRGHTAYPYSGVGSNTWTILETVQVNPANPNQIIDVYRNRAYATITDRAGTGSGITYNREHTWPNSLGFGSQTGNLGLPWAPYTDTHMLYLSDTQWNSDRGNKPFAYCASGCGERITEFNNGIGGGSGSYPGNSNWVQSPDGNQGSFEVWNARKGEMARAVLYMAIRYEGGVDTWSGQNEPNLELTDTRSFIVGTSNPNVTAYMGLLTDLLAWHNADPPDTAEHARNDIVYRYQGNRNPFIDHPEWATRALFESTTPAICVLDDTIFRDGFDAGSP